MRYALIKNAPLGNLLDRDEKSQVMWAKYGFKSEHMARLCVQGKDSNGDMAQLLPIYSDATFDAELPTLMSRIDGELFPDDSIEVIDDEARVAELKADIVSVREAAKVEADLMKMQSGDNTAVLAEMASLKSELAEIKALLLNK